MATDTLTDFVPCTLLLVLVALISFLYARYWRASTTSLPTIKRHWFSHRYNLLRSPWRGPLFANVYVPQYGDIFKISTPRKTVITLNSLEIVNEILEKRSAATSDRPQDIMLCEMMGLGGIVSLRNNDETYRKNRRIMTSALNQSAARSYTGLHTSTAAFFVRSLMHRLEREPKDSGNKNESIILVKAINDSIGRFMMRMIYGHVVVENDPTLALIEAQSKLISTALWESYWVNLLPILRYVPAWLPGAGFKREAQAFREQHAMTDQATFKPLMKQMREGRAQRVSYSSKVLEAKGGIQASIESVEMIQETAYTLFRGGVSTTIALIHSFMFMMAIHPGVAARLQTEIDARVGRDRLPMLEDRESLSYTNAVLQEVIRYCPVFPFGLEHCTSESIQVRGFTIEKGTAIEANIWALMREPSTYPDPHTFNPDRFLKQTPDPDPRRFVFGFGRRVCPGLHVANNATFTTCASFMSVFDIHAEEETMRQVNRCGRELWRMFTKHRPFEPMPFACRIESRDTAALSLLKTCEDVQIID